MDHRVASIWLKVSSKGKNTVHLGAIYCEHQWIRQEDPNLTGDIREQNFRWNLFINQREAASRSDTIVIGDFNLDMNKWSAPDSDHLIMTDMMKNRIETLGFTQVIEGDTRFWPGTPSSLIDHCWQNCTERIMSVKNVEIAVSDHNLQEIQIRINGSGTRPKEFLARDKIKWM